MTIAFHIRIITSSATQVRRKICDDMLNGLKSAPNVVVESAYIEALDPAELLKGNPRDKVNMDKTELALYDSQIRNMHIKHVSNALKHGAAIASLYEVSKKPPIAAQKTYYLVLEDDIIYKPTVVNDLLARLEQAPADSDVVMLGIGNGKSFQTIDTATQLLPQCDSYALTPRALQVLHETFLPVKFTTNVHLSYLFNKSMLKVMGCGEQIFVDGTKYGVYLSQLTANNSLTANNQYNQLLAMLEKPERELTAADEKSLEELIQQLKFKNHPDMIRLMAMNKMRQKNYKEAEAMLQSALDMLIQNDCLVNSESSVLKVYLSLYKYLQ